MRLILNKIWSWKPYKVTQLIGIFAKPILWYILLEGLLKRFVASDKHQNHLENFNDFLN